jgi:hypothetical protein
MTMTGIRKTTLWKRTSSSQNPNELPTMPTARLLPVPNGADVASQTSEVPGSEAVVMADRMHGGGNGHDENQPHRQHPNTSTSPVKGRLFFALPWSQQQPGPPSVPLLLHQITRTTTTTTITITVWLNGDEQASRPVGEEEGMVVYGEEVPNEVEVMLGEDGDTDGDMDGAAVVVSGATEDFKIPATSWTRRWRPGFVTLSSWLSSTTRMPKTRS